MLVNHYFCLGNHIPPLLLVRPAFLLVQPPSLRVKSIVFACLPQKQQQVVGGLEHFYFSIQLGISSSQLTFTYIFQGGRWKTTNQIIYIDIHTHPMNTTDISPTKTNTWWIMGVVNAPTSREQLLGFHPKVSCLGRALHFLALLVQLQATTGRQRGWLRIALF